jgi:hypothetical protein
MMDEMDRLIKMKQDGHIDQDEFAEMKKTLISKSRIHQ